MKTSSHKKVKILQVDQKEAVSPALQKRLTSVELESEARRRYGWGIRVFESARKKFVFDEFLLCRLAFLYDHLAFRYAKSKSVISRERLRRCLAEAEKIYRSVININRNNLFAWKGLSRIYQTRGDYRNALRYVFKARTILYGRPRRARGPLAIGSIYLEKGDHKNAELWFKKELNDLGRNSFGANANLLMFYINRKRYKEALPYALKTEQLLPGAIQLSHNRKFRTTKSNKTIAIIKRRINVVKKFEMKTRSS